MFPTDSPHRRIRLRMLLLAGHPKSPIPAIKKILKGSPSRGVSPAYHTSFLENPNLPVPVREGLALHLSTREILQLVLCSKQSRTTWLPTLYATVSLDTNRQCKTTLISLSKQPALAAHVRRLTVRPNCSEWTIPGEEINEDLLSRLLMQIAPSLTSLETFEWDGMDMPMDDLWLALRTSCPKLKRIGTSIGEAPLLATSHLYDFNDLRQVSLTVKCRSLEWLAEGMPKTEKLPRRFWEMLIERCPRLEELTLGGAFPSPRIFDVRHVTAGRWSRLRTITFGDAVLISCNKGEEQSRKDWESFMAFFAWHRSLTGIHLKHAPGSANFPSSFALPPVPESLPRLTSFSGPLKFVKSLPHRQILRDLSLTCLHHVSSSLPPTCALLQELPFLTSLAIWIDLSYNPAGKVSASPRSYTSSQHTDDVHVDFVKSVLAACGPHLTNLDLICFTHPPFSLKSFSSALTTTPNLRSFALTKIYLPGDEVMTRSAECIINDNPNLRHFSIRHTQESWFGHNGGRLRHVAQFEVLGPRPCERFQPVADPMAPTPTEETVTLLAYECRRGGLTGRAQSKTYTHIANISNDMQSIGRKGSKRSRRRSELSTMSSGSRSVWSWGSAAEQYSSPRSSISSERPSLLNKSPLSRHTSLRLSNDFVLV